MTRSRSPLVRMIPASHERTPMAATDPGDRHHVRLVTGTRTGVGPNARRPDPRCGSDGRRTRLQPGGWRHL